MRNTLKIIGISFAIHLFFYNTPAFFLMLWPCIGLFIGHLEFKSRFLRKVQGFEKFFLMCTTILMGPFTALVVTDWEEFNRNSPIKFPKVRNPFYYED